MAFFFTANIVWKSFILETKLSKSPSWQSIWNFWLVSKMSFPLETSQIQPQPGVIWFSWSQILWMKGLACVEKNEFRCFLKICRKLRDQVGCSLHLLHCRLFCDKSEYQKESQDLPQYCPDMRYKTNNCANILRWRGGTRKFSLVIESSTTIITRQSPYSVSSVYLLSRGQNWVIYPGAIWKANW